ncbi:hypothetical protein V6N13_106532 [Hibiscus sabdariffa]|uniref:Uncharacterized protein n=1 Tax=Hibiscus sabdariffa TaxID=183260 RepID=A0ABR2F0Z7_9ROSI
MTTKRKSPFQNWRRLLDSLSDHSRGDASHLCFVGTSSGSNVDVGNGNGSGSGSTGLFLMWKEDVNGSLIAFSVIHIDKDVEMGDENF